MRCGQENGSRTTPSIQENSQQKMVENFQEVAMRCCSHQQLARPDRFASCGSLGASSFIGDEKFYDLFISFPFLHQVPTVIRTVIFHWQFDFIVLLKKEQNRVIA